MKEVLSVDDIGVTYPARGWRRPPNIAVEAVNLEVSHGETLALVGESGSGKSTIGRAVLGLTPLSKGRIVLDGVDVSHRRDRQKSARSVQAIFQDPYGSLNPRRQIGHTLLGPLHAAGELDHAAAVHRVLALLAQVGLPADTMTRYPAQFSGGQRQRIAIARALSVRPKLIVCDEPTSALDVSTQAVVLQLLSQLQRETNVGYLFITHDLAVVRQFADRVIVLRRGQIVEQGPPSRICDDPQHPYTRALVAAAPVPDPARQRIRREARAELISSATQKGI
ncbi:ATP-binding cassette domain-containing protein [Rhodococcus sp. 14-2483-1-2]|uniref:ABC transporter ATP-binding protein n=1 Tax=Rhodococcus sp. 14-2483-1-2 TaxID=2023147 RepID=UPI000B9A9DCE|nr:ATP-binding cassette domain-containing protein [Rhodococcus sp. 14-2483-1-2]OZF26076.1 peptide ABC transporter ATP-binding protein [Rhodococcus sp. 14-2483-1-2]